jgi:pilus assembly protein Flp/PilA
VRCVTHRGADRWAAAHPMPPDADTGYNIVRPPALTHGPYQEAFVSPHPLVQFFADDSGQGLVEYALIIALISIVAIAAMRTLGSKVSNTLSNVAGSV